MVNFGWNSASILGVFLMVVGAGLYFLRSVRPELSRDYDIFFAAVGLACGGILVFNGWRLDPILQFGQFLLAGSTIFFAVESVRLRGVATEQARRNTPVVDDDRPVSRSYRAYQEPEYGGDYDQIGAYGDEGRPRPRQLRGTPEDRPSRRDRYEVEPPSPTPRNRRSRPSSNGSSYERPERPERPERSPRATRPPLTERSSEADAYPPASADRYSDRYDEWGEPYEEPAPRRPRSPEADPGTRDRPSRRPSRPDNRLDTFQDEEPAPYVDYVDYQPDPDEDDPPGPEGARPTPPYDDSPEAGYEDDYDADYEDDGGDYNPRAGSEY